MPDNKEITKLTDETVNDSQDTRVKKFTKVIQEHTDTYQSHLQRCDTIQKHIIQSYQLHDPTGRPDKLASHLMNQALIKIKKQFKPMDFSLYSGRQTEAARIITQSLTENAMSQAGWQRVLISDWGANDKQVTFGDAFIEFGPVDGRIPYAFRNASTTRVFFEARATVLREATHDREARKMVIVREYAEATAVKLFPQLVGKAGLGPVPNSHLQDQNNLKDQTEIQKTMQDKGLIEIAFGYDLDTEEMIIYAGPTAAIIGELEGADYPHRDMFDQAVLPIVQRIALSNPEGILNFGLGHVLYGIDILERILLNRGILYTVENLNPLRVVTVGGGKEGAFAAQVKRARRQQAAGKVGIVWNKINKGDFGGIDTLKTEQIMDEMNSMLAMVTEILGQWGINIKDTSTDPNKTFGAIELEAESSTDMVRYIQGRNAPEDKFAIEMFINYVARNIDDDNDLPIRANKLIRNKDGKEVEVKGPPGTDGFTWGDLARTYRDAMPEVVVNARSGVVNSHALEIARTERMLARTPVGSPAWLELMKTTAEMNGKNFQAEQFNPQPAPTAPAPAPAAAPGQEQPGGGKPFAI